MKRIFAFLLVMAVTVMLTVIPTESAGFDEEVGKEEIPYGAFGKNNTAYKYSGFDMMTADEAKAAGVPEGYSGYVLKLTAESGGMGIGLDLSRYRVKDIESITFRVYCPATTKNNGVRLTDSSSTTWIMLADPGAVSEWVDIVLSNESNFNTSNKSFDVFDDGNGYCKTVNFCFRFDGKNETGYIDSITVKLKDPDTVPPIIDYDGPEVIDTSEGRKLVLGITAYDEYDGKDVTPEYIWSDGALDARGDLVTGTHTCTVRAVDLAGNKSELMLTVNVGEKDTEAPKLDWSPDKIIAIVGSKPIFKVSATDNTDDVETVMTWSDGALDKRGRLTAGEHTLTLSVVDLTGNETEKQIKVYVTENISDENTVFDTH